MRRETESRAKRGKRYEPMVISGLVKCQLVGRTIRKLREDADLTQKQVAEALGVSDSLVSAWERGQRPFYIHHFHGFCHALGIEAIDFLKPYTKALESETKRTRRTPLGYI